MSRRKDRGDVVRRLRNEAANAEDFRTLVQAADEIEELRSQVQSLQGRATSAEKARANYEVFAYLTFVAVLLWISTFFRGCWWLHSGG